MDIKYFYHNKKDSTIIYIHGGPFFKVVSLDSDPYVKAMYEEGFNVAALNYTTTESSGGNADYMDILKEIRTTFKDITLKAIVGDSYGGYLATLLSYDIMCKTIVISGFISLSYQRLFSTESTWLLKYVDKHALDYLSHIGKSRKPISFIQGTNDLQCPYQQFLALKSNKENLILMNGYKHRENGTKLKNVIHCLIDELKNESI